MLSHCVVSEILPWSALVVYWPWVVAALDLVENAGHVTLIYLFGHAQGDTDRRVHISSCFSLVDEYRR